MKERRFLHFAIAIMMLFTVLFQNEAVILAVSTQSTTVVNSKKQFIQCIYKNMLAKEKKFVIKYSGDWHDLKVDNLDEVLDKVYAIDNKNTSDDFDYLKENIESYLFNVSSNGVATILTFTVNYRETKSQIAKVNNKVKKVIKSMKLGEKSDYHKVKKIHDYIVNLVNYDQTYSKYTAYNALFNKSSVCEGYALLFYKMATEAGVSCRIVTSDNHAWNIVRLGEKWYHIDVTWDDPISDKPVLRYDYFLKGSKTMAKTHTLSSMFTTKTFNRLYPISTSNYSK